MAGYTVPGHRDIGSPSPYRSPRAFISADKFPGAFHAPQWVFRTEAAWVPAKMRIAATAVKAMNFSIRGTCFGCVNFLPHKFSAF
jgi:hypothetical protein